MRFEEMIAEMSCGIINWKDEPDTLRNDILFGGNVSGESVYPSPGAFHLSRRIYVGMISVAQGVPNCVFRRGSGMILTHSRPKTDAKGVNVG